MYSYTNLGECLSFILKKKCCIHFGQQSTITVFKLCASSFFICFNVQPATDLKILIFTLWKYVLENSKTIYHSDLQIFQKAGSHLQILGARKVTWSEFHTEDSQHRSDPWTSPLSGTFSLVHVNWYTFLYARKKNCNNYVENMQHCKKFSCVDNQAPTICLPLVIVISFTTKKWSWQRQQPGHPKEASLESQLYSQIRN